MPQVTDQTLLSQLGAPQSGRVTDPALLAQLSGAPSGGPAAPTAPVAQEDPTSVYPVGSELGAFFRNIPGGITMAKDKLATGLAQRYAGMFEPSISPQLEQAAQRERAYYKPLASTVGGKVGEGGFYAPLALVPGANTAVGASLLGGAISGSQPTIGNEDWRINTGIGAALGGAGQRLGSAVGNWAVNRAAQPIMGHDINRLAAQAVGSDAPKLDQAAIGEARQALQDTYSAARSPNVSVPVGADSARAYAQITGDLENASSLKDFEGNKAVRDFYEQMTRPTGSPTAESLGSIGTRLRKQGSQILGQDGGNYELGNAYKALGSHVDDLIQGSITDPALAASYAAARPKYAILEDLRWNPSLLNAASGELNGPAYGRFLQRNLSDYSTGEMDSDLSRAASWAQATGEGKPKPGLDEPVRRLAYSLSNNAPVRAVGGLSSRALAPLGPALGPGGGQVPLLSYAPGQATSRGLLGPFGQSLAASTTPMAARLMAALRGQPPSGPVPAQ